MYRNRTPGKRRALNADHLLLRPFSGVGSGQSLRVSSQGSGKGQIRNGGIHDRGYYLTFNVASIRPMVKRGEKTERNGQSGRVACLSERLRSRNLGLDRNETEPLLRRILGIEVSPKPASGWVWHTALPRDVFREHPWFSYRHTREIQRSMLKEKRNGWRIITRCFSWLYSAR